MANIKLLLKKGDFEDATNYRRISITRALAEVFEKILQQQMIEYLDYFHLMSRHQFQFRKQFSSTDGLMLLTETIRAQVKCKILVAGALLDLSKAFESIEHNFVLKKFEYFGFDSYAYSYSELSDKQKS